jgi:PAS domain S-box-containing protein
MILSSLHFEHLSRTRLICYSVAIASVIVALLLTLLFQPLIQSTIFSLFFAAVTFSTWYGGLMAGLLATVLSVVSSNYFLFPMSATSSIRDSSNVLHLILFSIVALLVSSLNAELRAAKQRAEKNFVELQLSESRYRRIVDTAYEGIWLLDSDLRTEYVNQRLVEILEYSLEELRDRSFYDLMILETQIEAQAMIARLQQGDRQRFDGCFCCSDGTLRWAIVSMTPVLTPQNKFRGVLVMLTDITERKQAEAERTQVLIREQSARAEAEAANKTKDEFLAVLSHELRAPLSPILGWANLLKTQKLDPEKTNYAIDIIERNARLQNQLIADLLDVSRIVQGNLSLELCSVNLVSVIESAIETVRLTAIEKSIDLRLSVLEIEWENLAQVPESFSLAHSYHSLSSQKLYVSGDSHRLQQVVWNLLSNAVKFTPKSGRVEIRLSIVEHLNSSSSTNQHPRKFAQIQIIDTGKGIHPDFLPHVFESFRQADSTTTRIFGGLGLGLAIVDHLTKLHGGTVQAESLGEGQGSTFTVRLPLLESQVSNTNGSKLTLLSSLSLSGVKILVVEDEADTRAFLATTLERNGAIVQAVASANQALQVLQQTEQHLLISDIGMPEIDGYTLMRQVRSHEDWKNLPAIALTAYASEADRQESRSAGFQYHLTKPVESTELVSTIIRIIG